jgi:hypothetical protein
VPSAGRARQVDPGLWLRRCACATRGSSCQRGYRFCRPPVRCVGRGAERGRVAHGKVAARFRRDCRAGCAQGGKEVGPVFPFGSRPLLSGDMAACC